MAIPISVPIAQAALRSHEKSQPTSNGSVAAILKRCKTDLIVDWLERTKCTPELNHLQLSDDERTGHSSKVGGRYCGTREQTQVALQRQ
jgi:hypothetical protein